MIPYLGIDPLAGVKGCQGGREAIQTKIKENSNNKKSKIKSKFLLGEERGGQGTLYLSEVTDKSAETYRMEIQHNSHL